MPEGEGMTGEAIGTALDELDDGRITTMPDALSDALLALLGELQQANGLAPSQGKQPADWSPDESFQGARGVTSTSRHTSLRRGVILRAHRRAKVLTKVQRNFQVGYRGGVIHRSDAVDR